jgi:hypothetical protein
VHAVRLAYEVLDAQLVDEREEKVGRVDELLLELRDGEPPRVATILVGGPARARRGGRLMVALDRALRAIGRVRGEGVSRIPFDKVRQIAEEVQVEVKGDELEAMRVERWLSKHVVCRIPGAEGKKDKKVGGP